ncbi:putative RhoGEF domain containing protein [Blattamonas nauphoetae]|uniref:RhoGEF domain containing protein n=1 Tax=Blattamonas nauphoetae TaxID=2049346 RepID=A0ABQ9XLD0_9EUKA|nr:putative RhoGEF domain containing protein [Blattamonas nauphoetae]
MEILTTEETYTTHVGMLVHYLYQPLMKMANKGKVELSAKDINSIFNNIEQIFSINTAFFISLKDHFTDWSSTDFVGPILIKHIPTFKLYMQYFKNFKVAQDNVKLYLSKHRQFRRFCSDPTNSAFSEFIPKPFVFLGKEMPFDHQPFENYLIMPIQRIPRYKMLIEALLKNTPKQLRDHAHLTKSMELMTEVAYMLDYSAKPRKDDTARLWEIAQSIKGYPGEFLRKQRQFFLQSEVRRHTDSSKAQTLFLFGDSILVCTSGSGHTFDFKEEISLEKIEVVRIGDVPGEDIAVGSTPPSRPSAQKEKKTSEQKKYPHLLVIVSRKKTHLFSFNDSPAQKSAEVRDDWFLRIEMLLQRVRSRNSRREESKKAKPAQPTSRPGSVANSLRNSVDLARSADFVSQSPQNGPSPAATPNVNELPLPSTRQRLSKCTLPIRVPKNTKLWKALLGDEGLDWAALEEARTAKSKKKKESKSDKEKDKTKAPSPLSSNSPLARLSSTNSERSMSVPTTPAPLPVAAPQPEASSHFVQMRQQLVSSRQSLPQTGIRPLTLSHNSPPVPPPAQLRPKSMYFGPNALEPPVAQGLRSRFLAIEKQTTMVMGSSEKGEMERLKSQQAIFDRMVKDAEAFEKEGEKEIASQKKMKEQARLASQKSAASSPQPSNHVSAPKKTPHAQPGKAESKGISLMGLQIIGSDEPFQKPKPIPTKQKQDGPSGGISLEGLQIVEAPKPAADCPHESPSLPPPPPFSPPDGQPPILPTPPPAPVLTHAPAPLAVVAPSTAPNWRQSLRKTEKDTHDQPPPKEPIALERVKLQPVSDKKLPPPPSAEQNRPLVTLKHTTVPSSSSARLSSTTPSNPPLKSASCDQRPVSQTLHLTCPILVEDGDEILDPLDFQLDEWWIL